jgi:pectate lyase
MPMSKILWHAQTLVAVLLASGATSACAQLPAFPGAEGFGRLATGGRGGDVYRVTNLNNSGAGSLRNGITTAPAAGRTIVFDVAGTIRLASSLNLGGRDNITIAGQTAPAGGITLADHGLRIDNADNVILQHIRIRPGSTFGSQDPDAIWVSNSANVIIDHVTASWGVDETISVTNDSNNVTVQWSTMTQGLFNAGHSGDDGVGHSYGSLLNGGRYSFHHNLYAHSKSRHPRAQDSGNRYLMVDWVNNVVANPGDEFGNSDADDPYDMNLVGNYGIKGPQSGSNTSYLMRPQDVDSRFYVAGNMMDADRNLVLNGVPMNGGQAFRPGGAFTLMPQRFDFPQVTTHTAEQAYIQVMSRAGANRYRDAIDRRTIRTVMNHLRGFIDTEADWGGWPDLPTGAAAPDANGDGVPDAWATANGFDPSSPLNQTFAPDGYTYLEKYIHSLSQGAYPAAGTTTHTIPTSFGRGADAQVSENGGAMAVAAGDGAGDSLTAEWAGATGSVNQAIVLRFDLSQVAPGSLNAARLELTTASSVTGAHTFMVYGLEHDAAGGNWEEASIDFATAPGLVFDGASGTLGVSNAFNATNHPDNPNLLTLGQITIPTTAAGETVSLTNPNLAVFLNLAAYYEGQPAEDLATIVLQQTTIGTPASFVSKEGDALLAPRLVIGGLVDAGPQFDPADFNGDGVVSDADLSVWSSHFGTPNGASRTTGDADADGDVDGGDFLVWQRRLGNASPAAKRSSARVPEPNGAALALAVLASLAARSHSMSGRGLLQSPA